MKIRIKENTFTAEFTDGTVKSFLKGTDVIEIISIVSPPSYQNIVLARINNRIVDINEQIGENCYIEWLYKDSPQTIHFYKQTLCFILLRAFHEIFPDKKLLIDHSIGDGLYCEPVPAENLTKKNVKKIKSRIIEIINKNEPITAKNLLLDQAREELIIKGESSSLFFGIKEKSYLKFSSSGKYLNFLNSPLFCKTGFLNIFDLLYHPPGLILRLPEQIGIKKLPVYTKYKKIFSVFQEYREWENIVNIQKAADINDAISNKTISKIIKTAEGLHEKKIASIADNITSNRDIIHTVLIAGPSSSGKTTFAKRLEIQLRINGLKPLILSLDDYFLSKDKTPIDKEGKPDIESPNALDINRLNSDLTGLFRGKMVELPKFDFKNQKQISGPSFRLSPNNPVLIEGIHALNNSITSSISKKRKLKIYVSALTQLNITDHIRVPTSDIRLLRRLIRDYKFRKNSLAYTLNQWPQVRKGEEKNIFPFQESADIIFNSSLMYEPAVLRFMLKPLLNSILNKEYIYSEAYRLSQLLYFFMPITPQEIPLNSILREFIGNSSFSY